MAYTYRVPSTVGAHLRSDPNRDDDPHDKFFALAEKIELTQAQVENLLDYFYEGVVAADQQRVADEEATTRRAEEALGREWGKEHDVNVEFARKAVATIFGEEAGADLANTKLEGGRLLGNSPSFIKAMASLGRAYATQPGVPESVAHPSAHPAPPATEAQQETRMDKATALARIEELQGLRDTNLAKFQDTRTQDELTAAYEAAFGNEPADGSENIDGKGLGAVQVGAPDADPAEEAAA